MKSYIGIKRVNAGRMTRQTYNDFRGWKLPADENGADDGYLVESVNGPANTAAYDGYISWLPTEVFNLEFRPVDGLTFGEALEALKAGYKVARKGWNGKGMWLICVPGTSDAQLREGTPYYEALGEATCQILPHIDMWTVDSTGRRAMLPGWLASQTDMLSEDWEIIDEYK